MEDSPITGGYVLAIDIGTTSIRSHIFDRQANLIANKSENIPLIFPQPHCIEQDPILLWKHCVTVIRESIKEAKITACDLHCVGKVLFLLKID